jgi:acetyltransferase
MRNLLGGGYRGRIYPVNLRAESILGLPAYRSVKEVPHDVDLAVVAVPAASVLEVARQCGRKGVKFLVVISAGFREIGGEGSRREKELVSICREFNMGLVGPNCLGIIDTHTPLNATFAPQMPQDGKIAFFSQSGALGVAILDWSLTTGIGFSRFVSLGNKAGLDEVDFIQDAAQDPYTEVILCYLEGIADGRRFLEVAREVTRQKPVIVIKAGASEAGARAASSHTGSLAGSEVAYTAAFRQGGIFRAYSTEELFDLALAFSTQPLPRANRVAVLTNAGGPGILATDAAERQGLAVARLSKETVEELRKNLPPEASLYNPVDVLGDAPPERYAVALEKLGNDPHIDSLLALLTPQAGIPATQIAHLVADYHQEKRGKPLVAAFMGGEAVREAVSVLKNRGIPCYPTPERAVAALAALARYAMVRQKSAVKARECPTPNPAARDKAEEIFQQVRQDRRAVLLGSEAVAVAEAFGIPCARTRLARSPEEAVAIAREIGFPVALKIASPHIVHKTDIGGVRLGLSSAEEVRRAYVEIVESVQRFFSQADIYGVEVQQMMPPGTELIIGITRDTQFGPLLMFGLGGVYVDLLKDVAFRLTYGLSRDDVLEMIRETKAYTLLRGYRGQPPRDMESLAEVLCRVARLAEELPGLVEMDINPVLAYEQGLAALDVKMTIA